MEFQEEPTPGNIKPDPIQIIVIVQTDQSTDHPKIEVVELIPGLQIPEVLVQLEDLLQPEVPEQQPEAPAAQAEVLEPQDHLQEEVLPGEGETKIRFKSNLSL